MLLQIVFAPATTRTTTGTESNMIDFQIPHIAKKSPVPLTELRGISFLSGNSRRNSLKSHVIAYHTLLSHIFAIFVTKSRMDMNSAAQKIEDFIENYGRGRIFFADDFVSMGSAENIRQALGRFTKSEKIVRVANGIYCYPEIDDKLGLGALMPSFDQIAKAIAERSHARIVPTGDYALNVLGLSTQVPMNYVYLTDGSPRKVEISGGRGIVFKKTAPKNLAFKNRLAMLVTSALKSIGRDNVTQEQISQIEQLLRKEDKEAVLADLVLMPIWIRKIVTKAYE